LSGRCTGALAVSAPIIAAPGALALQYDTCTDCNVPY
jgi:hypothetical protein